MDEKTWIFELFINIIFVILSKDLKDMDLILIFRCRDGTTW